MKKILMIYTIITGIVFNVSGNDDNPPTAIGLITGSVIDATSREPMPYVNVVVRNSSDSILTGGITDERGNFVIGEIPDGNNKVEILFMGYEKITREVDFSNDNSNHNLSTIMLNESTWELEEVVVRGEVSTVTQKIDRTVINVGKDLTATGTNAAELLNNVQSVSVNSQTGSVSLRGNENVEILVDGRPTNVSAAQLLQQIPSTSIKSIELITNPSAKYNPEGMSGIINIVLYKNASLGFNGSLISGLTAGKNLRYNGAVDLNYRKGKVNLFANYGGSTGQNSSVGGVWRTDNSSYSDFRTNRYNTSHLVKAGADLYIDKANTLSVFTIQNLFDGSTSSRTLIYFEDILDSENPYETEKENYTGTYNLNYKHDFTKEGHNIEFEGSYALTDQYEEGTYDQVTNPVDLTSNYVEDIHNDMISTILNLDYTNPISENAKLEVGLETRFRDTRNLRNTTQHQFVYDDNNMPIPDGDDWFLATGVGGSAFSYDRNIYSAYTNYNQKIEKFSMQLGLRAEQYEVDAVFDQGEETESYREEKFTLYPSAFFTYAPGEKNQFQLSYSRRVDRPSISQVNPIRSWSTPLLTMVGNPGLKPQFTDSYEINYTRRLKKGSISLGTFFRRINDNIIRYASTDPFDENKVVLTFVNAEYEDRYGVEMSGMYRPTGWWNINASFDLYSQQMSGYAFGEFVEIGSISTNVRMNNSFKATENLSFQLFGMYRGSKEIIQWIIQPMWMINAGASLKVLRRKGTISVRVNDIFNTMNFEFESTNFYPSTGGFFWESRTAYVGFTYNFGRGDFKAMKRRNRDSNEFQGSGGF